ncbi:MAG: putative aminopeptidase [Hyphomicrobiaceae bacterium]|jgi:predicted aminopeptidase
MVASLVLPGCRAAYLSQLAWQQVRYLSGAQSIEELIKHEGDPGRRARLELVLEVRRFAASQGLDPEGSFAKVADTEGTKPFQVVTAAHADRLEAYTWWYPVIGAVPYRGYFDRESAEAFAQTLRDEHLDVRIVEASAYSTLGWFNDPLPAGLLENDSVEIAVVVLHELVHQHYFLPGSVDFNETLANALGYHLAERFFAERADTESVATVVAARSRWLERSRVLDDLALRLEEYFSEARSGDISFDNMLSGRARLYEKARAELEAAGVLRSSTRGKEFPLDNATFLAVRRYARAAPLIDSFVGQHGGDARALEALRELDMGDGPFAALETEAGLAPIVSPP